MIGYTGLRQSRKKRQKADPMAGVANLSDVMLVLACGLMMAIIMYWKVDLTKVVDTFNEKDLTAVDDPEVILNDDSESSRFEERGIVVVDPDSGEMYVIER